jgi:hypothetical protein
MERSMNRRARGRRALVLLIFATAIGLSACGEAGLEVFGANPTPFPTPVGAPQFRRDVLPILQTARVKVNGCGAPGQCHYQSTEHPAQNGLALVGATLTSDMIWANIRAGGVTGMDVDTANAPSSRFVTYPRSNDNDQHDPFFTEDDPAYKVLVGWIADGARND